VTSRLNAVLVALVVLMVGLTAWLLLPGRPPARPPAPSRIRVGYFHGGRTNLLFRAYVANEFEKAGVPLDLETKQLHASDYHVIPRDWERVSRDISDTGVERFGKATGLELISEIEKGRLDGGTVGESSFLDELEHDAPVVAVAMLGHDTLKKPGHCLIFRKGVVVRTPADFKGKVLASRRAGPGDEVFLREFLVQNGLDPDRDVTIKEGTSDDMMEEGLRNGDFDGGYYHLMTAKRVIAKGEAWLYRPLNWASAELSLALLVFRRDYVRDHRAEIVELIKVYMRRIQYENSLPDDERTRPRPKGMQMAEDFLGMDYPQCDMPPLVRMPLLTGMEDLLIKHHYLPHPIPNLAAHVDNSLVEEAARDLGATSTTAP
jgi:hypothetical protein